MTRFLVFAALTFATASTFAQDAPPQSPDTSGEQAPSVSADEHTEAETTAPSPRSTTEAAPSTSPASPDEEQEAEEEESGDGVLYIQALGGYSYANLVQFRSDNFIPSAEERSGSGAFGGIGVGARFAWFTLGARATVARFADFDLGGVGADIGVHFPVPFIQPYIRVGIGFAWLGTANFSEPRLSDTDVHGLYVDSGAGVDLRLLSWLSLGAGFDVAFLNLGRQSVRDAGTVNMVNFEEDGDGAGLQIRVHAQATIHI